MENEAVSLAAWLSTHCCGLIFFCVILPGPQLRISAVFCSYLPYDLLREKNILEEKERHICKYCYTYAVTEPLLI